MDTIRSFCYNNGEKTLASSNNCHVIIGRAKKGPICTPVFAKTLADYTNMASIFGTDSELLTAFYEACDGTSEICLINIEGIYPSLQLKNLIRFEAKDIDDKYNKDSLNQIRVIFNKDKIRFEMDNSLLKVEYPFEDETINSLAEKINNDAMLNVSPVIATYFSTTSYEPANSLYDALIELAPNKEIILSKENIFSDNYHNFTNIINEILEEEISSITILPFSFYEKEKEPFNILDIYESKDLIYEVEVGDEIKNICYQIEVNTDTYNAIETNDNIYLYNNDEELIFQVLDKRNNYLFVIPEDNKTYYNISDLKNIKILFRRRLYIYEILNNYLKENLKNGYIQFVNMGIKPEEEINLNVINNFYNYIKETAAINPFINIIIDKYKNKVFYSDYNNYSNGLGFLLKSMNTVQDFNNIIGMINDTFNESMNNLSNEEIEDLSDKGFITTCYIKRKHRINSGKNLSYNGNNVLGTIGNTILVQQISKNIINNLTSNMSDIQIKNTIATLFKEVYYDVVSSYKIDITSNIDKTKTINKIVKLDICLYGYITSINLSVGVE